MKRTLYAFLIALMVISASDGAAAKKRPRKEPKEATFTAVTPESEESEAEEKRERRQRRTARIEKNKKQVGGFSTEKVDKKPVTIGPPVERKAFKATGHVFDLRALPAVKPKNRERPEREGPEPAPVMIDGGEVPSLVKTAPRLPVTEAVAPAPIITFDGLDRQNWGAGSPPDTNGDAGPDYYIQSVNTSVGVYRKSDGFQEAAFTFDTLMSQGSFGNQCDTENFGDPVVLYDTFEDRWVLSDFAFTLDGGGAVNPPIAYQCFAVSMNGDPISGGWNFYSIAVTDGLNDYPKLAVWTDGIYMSANVFGYGAGAALQTARVWAFNKAQMYAGEPTVQIVSFDVSADFTVVPSNARLQTGTPPAGRPNYFLSTWNYLNALTVYQFHADWNSLALSSFTGPDTPLAATSWPNAAVGNAAQSGTATLLDVLQIRAMVQNQYTNLGGVESLWVPHTVRRAAGGLAAPRWYQVDITGGPVNPTIPQAATWDPDAANVINRFMPSLAIDRGGNMALGYSTSSSTTIPALKYAGRLATDPVNTFSQTEQVLFAGEASQTGSTRWGDYSSMTLDPDGCTFWYTSEYGNTDQAFDKRWKTRIGSFKYPECTPVGAGGTISGTVTATAGGAPIAGADIQFGARSTTTDGSGVYTFADIPAGTYPSITASKPGFISSTATNIVVTDGSTTTQDFSLATAPTSACATDTTQADFLTGIGSGVDVDTSPGDVILSIPSESNSSIGTSGVGITVTTWGGQTFTPAASGTLAAVDVNLFCSGCTGTTPNLTLSIRGTAAGLPTGADLATATIPGFSNGGVSSYFTATFGVPPALTAGTMYAFVIRPTANPSPGTYALTRSGTASVGADVYAGGTRVAGATSGTVWSIPTTGAVTTDTGFVTHMASGFGASGTFVSSVKDSNPAGGLTPVWTTLSWTAVTPTNTAVSFQIAGSNSPIGPFTFVGPDGTAGTFFTVSGASLTQFYDFRYLKYKAYLATTDAVVTPTLNDVTLCYVNTDCSGPAPAITPAPAQVCPSSTGNTASVPSGATSYAWSITNGSITGGGSTDTVTYDAGASGTVDLQVDIVDAAGCHDTANISVPIGIPATPTITPGGPTTFCAGGSVTLTSSSATSNQWYLDGNPIGGATNQTYNATLSGDYTVTVAAVGGCTSLPSAATTVTVNPTPATPTITPGGPTTFCTGGSVTLTSSSATGNQWYLDGNPIGGEINQAYVATASGSYTVVVTELGCPSASSAATVVTVNPTPATPTITPGGPTTFCAGGSVTLTSSSATGNQWYLNGNPIGGETAQQYVATASGSYTVVVTASGCPSASSSATAVTVNPVPATPTITPGGPTAFCAGGNVTLTSNSASGNQWYLNGNPIGGETGQQYVATASGDYTVVVTTSGCSSNASATTSVTVNPLPNATITAPGSVVAGAGGSASVADAGVGATYVWGITNGSFVGLTNGNSVNFTAGAAGSLGLSVTVTTAASCGDSDTANVTVTAAPPAVTVTSVSPNSGTIAGGSSVTITGTGFVIGASATFGGSAATSVVVVNATTITAVTPAHVAGAVNVTVTNTDTSTATLTNGYTYLTQQFDANNDGMVDPSDIFYLVNYLFSGGPAPAGPAGLMSGDANGDHVVDPADIFYIVNYLFLGGPAPVARTSNVGVATEAVGGRLAGTLTLGTPVVREGRTFIPVMVSTAAGSLEPQALSLKLRVAGDASIVAVRRVGAAKTVQPVLEMTRSLADGAAYLVALDRSLTGVIAEIELTRGTAGQVRVDVDPSLTMLSRGGVAQATVRTGTLQIRGVTIDPSSDRRPNAQERN